MKVMLEYIPLISPILVILGWIVVNIQNNRRETRKEIRMILNLLYSELDELVDKSIEFHINNWNGVDAKKITTKIDRVISSINSVSDIMGIECHTESKELRQAITLNNFDKSSHSRLSGEEDIITEIADASYIISSKLESSFIHKYLSNKLWWLI